MPGRDKRHAFRAGALVASTLAAVAGCSDALSVHRRLDAAAADATVEDTSAGVDRDGAAIATEVGGGPAVGSFEATAVAIKGSGNIVVAGVLQGTVDLGAGPLTSAGNTDLVVAEFDPAFTLRWSRRFGDATQQSGAVVAVDAADETLVATGFSGALALGGDPLLSAGATDVGLVMLDPTGRVLWSKSLGDADYQSPFALVADTAGGFVLAVQFGSSMSSEGTSLSRLTAAGDTVWAKSWQGVYARALAPGAAGAALVSGWFWNTVDLGGTTLGSAGFEDIFVVAMATTGDCLWGRGFGGPGSDLAFGLAVDGAGATFITGSFDDTLDFGTGTPLVSVLDAQRFGPSRDMFVAKLDPSGAPLWSRRFGDSASDQEGAAIAADGAGGVFVLGAVGASIDFGLGPLVAANGPGFLARFDGQGQTVWQQSLPGWSQVVRAAAPGVALLAGAFPRSGGVLGASRFLAGGSDVALLEYTP